MRAIVQAESAIELPLCPWTSRIDQVIGHARTRGRAPGEHFLYRRGERPLPDLKNGDPTAVPINDGE
jgi:hypothetical protein